jgi:hypothetical protein
VAHGQAREPGGAAEEEQRRSGARRKKRKVGDGADRWAPRVRGRGRGAVCWAVGSAEEAGQQGKGEAAVRAGPSGGGLGRCEGKEGGRGLGFWASWAGLGFFLFFWFPFPFLFQTNSNLFEFKSTLNSNSYALNQIKIMHQHECATMLN